MLQLSEDIDVSAVYDTILEHEEAIIALDDEIEVLMSTIRKIQHQKQQRLLEIRKCKGRITLARRLPSELLASIFEECVLDGWTRTPLVVSHVCRTWRKAALTPSVWSHIYVNLNARDPLQRTALWLQRSQNTLLTIDLEVGVDLSHLNNVTKMLLKEVQRWKVLNVTSTLLEPVNQILQACNEPSPQLRAMDISIDQEFILANNVDDDRHELVGLRASFADAPRFRSLHISRNVLPGRHILPSSIVDLFLRLPCQHTSTSQSLSAIIRLLEELPQLKSFSMEVPNGHYQRFQLDVEHGQLADLPSLESLTLMGANNIFGFLPHIRVPSLSYLFLRSSLEYIQAEEIALWLVRFLKESSPSLKVLEFRDLALDQHVYGRLFPLLPLLEELHLHDSDILDTDLEGLRGPQGFCPLLKQLDLRWCGRLSGRALVAFVRSRLPADIDSAVLPTVSKSIEEITLINCSFVKEEDIIDLADMTVCRLIHRGQEDFCRAFGCCDNERYRRRLKQRGTFHPSMQHTRFRVIF
ncbi:hypothetical protein CPB84DRAFT_1669208 [Gymnopilus junonius]|uniref:F-box domain-containing protein n=1 Tax=Gymnopilus junonius TaxID=109634 RepID=A0A9P5NYF8_GYMJU|nr:hypothetical protein CPB84DRAFT_1669208 [Gymnopilus junonius]